MLPAALGACASANDYETQIGRTWSAPAKNSAAEIREIVRCATLAANSHNAQAWKFAIKDEAIEIHPDFTRRLTVVDPQDRELWISLGCALENLLIAARSYGLAGEVSYPDAANPLISAHLTPAAPAADRLFHAIPLRQNTRSEYSGAAAGVDELRKVEATPLEAGVGLKLIVDRAELETVVEYVNAGNVRQYGDPAFLEELISWLRFNEKEALASLDGLYSKCSGNPTVPRWLGEKFISGTKPAQQADADAKKLRSCAGAAIITTPSDDPASWVRAGRVYQRLALAMTALDIKSAFLNQPIETPDIRPQFQSALGLGDQLPQLLLRFGYAASLPKSLRRPVESVLI
jgi:hypothetical protein